jgi:hypothetical protein
MPPHTASASVLLHLTLCSITTNSIRKPLTNIGYQMKQYEMVQYKNWLKKIKMPSTTEIGSDNKWCIGKDKRNLCMYAVSILLQTSNIVKSSITDTFSTWHSIVIKLYF